LVSCLNLHIIVSFLCQEKEKMNLTFYLNGKEFFLKVMERENGIEISIDNEKYMVEAEKINENEFLLNMNGKVYNVIIYPSKQNYSVSVNGKLFQIEKQSFTKFLERSGKLVKKKREVKASMSGKVVRILAKEGDEVKENQGVLVLEAMKMENEIKSPKSGKITRIAVSEGGSVEAGNLLFIVE